MTVIKPVKLAFVVVDIKVVRSREEGDDRGKAGGETLTIHAIARILCLVSADHREKLVVFQEAAGRRIAVKTIASA